MLHRHLNHESLTLAAIEDIIARGRWSDWAELRRGVLGDSATRENVARICRARVADPYAQRFHFWMHYVESSPAAA